MWKITVNIFRMLSRENGTMYELKYVCWSGDFWSNGEAELDLESEVTIFRVWIFESEITNELT